MKAREWLDRGKKITDPIDSFSSYWCGFNNLFASAGHGKERDLIKSYLGTSITPEQALEILDTNATNVDYLLSQPVIDMRGNGKDTSTNIQAFNATVDAKAKLFEIFMVIYQVRCNLVHGQKSPSRDRDIRLCACAAPLISCVLELNA